MADLECGLDVRCRDAVVGDETNARWVQRLTQKASAPALFLELCAGQSFCATARARDVEIDEVGLDATEVAADPWHLSEAFRQRSRVGVVFSQAVHHRVEGDQTCSRKHACLTHAPAETLAPASRLVNRFSRAAEEAAGRAGEALRDAERDRVRGRSDVRDVNAKGNCRVEDASSIEMHANAVGACSVGGCLKCVKRPDDAAVPVVGVLQEQRCRKREVVVVARPHRCVDLLWGHHAGWGRDLLDLHARDGRSAGPFI